MLILFIILYKMTEENSQTISDIKEYGLSVIIIEATNYFPSFAYSIGLWQQYQHPELICFGLTIETLHTLINDVAEKVKNGEQIETGKNYPDIFEHGRAEFLNVDPRNLEDYFGTAINFYNSSEL